MVQYSIIKNLSHFSLCSLAIMCATHGSCSFLLSQIFQLLATKQNNIYKEDDDKTFKLVFTLDKNHIFPLYSWNSLSGLFCFFLKIKDIPV